MKKKLNFIFRIAHYKDMIIKPNYWAIYFTSRLLSAAFVYLIIIIKYVNVCLLVLKNETNLTLQSEN